MSKQRDAKDKERSLPEKVKQFFKFGKEVPRNAGISPGVSDDSHRTEYVLPSQTIKDISSISPLTHRLKTLKDLSDIVSKHKLEDHAIERLWGLVKDLLLPECSVEVRHQVIYFMASLIKGQFEKLHILRTHFFNFILNHSIPEDIAPRLELLKILSDNGKNIINFEEEIGPFLLSWMPEVISTGKSKKFLPILINMIKFNAAYLDQDIISGLVKHTCILSNRTSQEEDIVLCLDTFDAIICYSYLPSDALYFFIESLCRVINMAKFTEATLKLMRKFLGTHLGHSGIFAMCKLLQEKKYLQDFRLLRGAIFFIGMCLWGSQKVPSLKHTPSAVLPSFLCVMNGSNNTAVAWEIIMSINRLVRKYGKDLDLFTWELVIDIILCIMNHIEKNSFGEKLTIEMEKVKSELHCTLSAIEDLYESSNYMGSADRLFQTIEKVSKSRPESSVIKLIQYQSQFLYPTKNNWINNIAKLMERYYKCETRTNIRIEALHILTSVLCATRFLYEDELIDRVVILHLSKLNIDPDRAVRNVAVQLLVDLAMDCNSNQCLDLLETIKNVINHPFSSLQEGKESSDIVHILDETELTDVKTGVQGLIEIVQHKIHCSSSVFAITAHKYLILNLLSHYENPVVFEQASSLRYMIIDYLMRIRANSYRQIGILNENGEDSPKVHEYSSYIICSMLDIIYYVVYRSDNPGTNSSSVPTKSSSSIISNSPTQLSMESMFDALVTCLKMEKDWTVLNLILMKLPFMLQNKTLILSCKGTSEKLCDNLCSLVSNRWSNFPEVLQNRPTNFTRSDFHLYIFPTLGALSSYNKYLSVKMQKTLVKCLKFGLVSRCAGMCINALTDCTLEMQEVMYKLLPEVLLSLSKISATVGISSSILEFLSTLIMLPSLYTSFVEDQYMSIFAIALPYTNPFKFNHYIVSMAHHGLSANVPVQIPCEENSENSRRRSSSLNEAQQSSTQSLKRGSLLPNLNKSSGETRSPFDQAMLTFHHELTDTCLDFLARYAFSTCSALPNRSPLAEFLLKGGQTASWLLGYNIITITTSGCGSKVLRQGLCQKCHQLCRNQSEVDADIAEDLPPINHRRDADANIKSRRRHQSAAVLSSDKRNPPSWPPSITTDDIVVQRTHSFGVECIDDSIEPRSSENTSYSGSTSKSSEHGLTHSVEEPEAQNIDKLLFGHDKNPLKFDEDKETHPRPRHLCSCWCQGWAEVKIRRPTGNTSWMMRIQNEPYLVANSPSDFPLADIASLFLPSKLDNFSESSYEMYDVVGHKRIDSESLGENEYEALYQEQFESNSSKHRRLRHSDISKTDNPSQMDSTQPIDQPSSSSERDVQDQEPKDTENKEENNEIINPSEKENVVSEVSSSTVSSTVDKTNEPDKPSLNTKDEYSKSSKSPKNLETIPAILEGEEAKMCSPPSNSGENDKTSNLPQPCSPLPLDLKLSSPPSSPHNLKSADSSSLEPMLRGRGYTISVMTPAEGNTSQEYPRSTTNREIYKTGINPSFVFLQLFHNCFFGSKMERPLMIPKNEAMSRAIKCLDLIPPYETHKIGVIFVDKDQCKNEAAILANEFGSIRYTKFLAGIGTLIRLNDINPQTTYTAGLDTSDGEDGKFTYLWQDDVMQVIFHVPTLMPTKRETDPSCSNKKRHIGNDFVLIVYNDSGENFKISTMKGQFIYACIVIEPVDYQSNIITIKAKPDLAEVIGHEEPKIVSDNNLATVVRQLALHANLASRIHRNQGSNPQNPYASNWLERLRQIKRYRKKVIDHYSKNEISDNDTGKENYSNMDFTDYVS
ncbi:Tuberin [Nymphon striatum]|nr:Tuberin [Nymphon striatum]